MVPAALPTKVLGGDSVEWVCAGAPCVPTGHPNTSSSLFLPGLALEQHREVTGDLVLGIFAGVTRFFLLATKESFWSGGVKLCCVVA